MHISLEKSLWRKLWGWAVVVESKRTATATPKLHVRSMRHVIRDYPSISWCPKSYQRRWCRRIHITLGAFLAPLLHLTGRFPSLIDVWTLGDVPTCPVLVWGWAENREWDESFALRSCQQKGVEDNLTPNSRGEFHCCALICRSQTTSLEIQSRFIAFCVVWFYLGVDGMIEWEMQASGKWRMHKIVTSVKKRSPFTLATRKF